MITLPANCEFNYAPTLKNELGKELAQGGGIAVDMRSVERMSLACVQILIAAVIKARKTDRTVKIDSSETVHAIFEDLGVCEVLAPGQ